MHYDIVDFQTRRVKYQLRRVKLDIEANPS